ncbi:MAG: chondroitin 4-O-sulfotransferase [Chloroflexaceae bacterium]|nr:chondroitin 4-O-sulfotransferase [Chloroflexaceae bacterium]
MIVSHEHQFIFLKTTKTAGTSIEIALSQHCGPKDIITRIAKNDEAVRQSLGFRGPQNLGVPFYKYTRTDWGRLIKKGKPQKYYNHIPASLVKRYVGDRIWREYFIFTFERNPYDKAISRYYWELRRRELPELEGYLNQVGPRMLSNWHIYTIDDRVSADFVGRFERLTEDLGEVWQRLGLPGSPHLPQTKSGYRKDKSHYSTLLTPAARSRIETVCAREIVEFGYQFERISP